VLVLVLVLERGDVDGRGLGEADRRGWWGRLRVPLSLSTSTAALSTIGNATGLALSVVPSTHMVWKVPPNMVWKVPPKMRAVRHYAADSSGLAAVPSCSCSVAKRRCSCS